MKAMLSMLIVALPVLCAAEVVVPIDAVESHVNIRLSPNAKSEIVGRLEQGSSAVLVTTLDGWHEVEIVGGSTGFISADWTNVLAEAPEPIATPTPELPDELEAVATDNSSEKADKQAVSTDESARSDDGTDAGGDIETLRTAVGSEAEATAAAAEEVAAEEIAPATDDTVAESDAAPLVADSPTGTGPQGPTGDIGAPGPPGPPGAANIKGTDDFLVKFKGTTAGRDSQIYDDGNQVGIGTTEPKQRLEVNGNIQVHNRNSSVAGVMITQSSGETGYIMHNRASTLTIGAGSVDRITINRDGNVGFGVVRPAHPIDTASGAYLSSGGVWTNSSSRERKENIAGLSAEAALATLEQLEPVQFNYRNDQREAHIGFIAEDVPALVATSDRNGLSAMDIVAVLTKVVQTQQAQIRELETRLENSGH